MKAYQYLICYYPLKNNGSANCECVKCVDTNADPIVVQFISTNERKVETFARSHLKEFCPWYDELNYDDFDILDIFFFIKDTCPKLIMAQFNCVEI